MYSSRIFPLLEFSTSRVSLLSSTIPSRPTLAHLVISKPNYYHTASLVLLHCLCQVTVQHRHVQIIRNDIGQLKEIRPNTGLKLPKVNFCSPVEQLNRVTFFNVLYLSLSPHTKCIYTPTVFPLPFES